jgi:cytochrome c biogenesis protein CcdA
MFTSDAAHAVLSPHEDVDADPATLRRASMSIISLLIVLIIVGVALYLVNNLIPMDQKIKTILNVVVVIVILLWLLDVFGLASGLGHYRIGR